MLGGDGRQGPKLGGTGDLRGPLLLRGAVGTTKAKALGAMWVDNGMI